jgi:hypothetical protein
VPKIVQAEVEITVTVEFAVEDDENPDEKLDEIIDQFSVDYSGAHHSVVDINYEPLIISIEETLNEDPTPP